MSVFSMGAGQCGVCGRGSCVPSFHSFAEQDVADRRAAGKCSERGCHSKSGPDGYCSYHWDQISSTVGT